MYDQLATYLRLSGKNLTDLIPRLEEIPQNGRVLDSQKGPLPS